MNERIQELAEQAGFENGHQDSNGNSLSYELEKFAELIVRECVNRVRSRQQFAIEDNQNVTQAFDLLVYDIESHFGVDE
jgi:hypothetical protein